MYWAMLRSLKNRINFLKIKDVDYIYFSGFCVGSRSCKCNKSTLLKFQIFLIKNLFKTWVVTSQLVCIMQGQLTINIQITFAFTNYFEFIPYTSCTSKNCECRMLVGFTLFFNRAVLGAQKKYPKVKSVIQTHLDLFELILILLSGFRVPSIFLFNI